MGAAMTPACLSEELDAGQMNMTREGGRVEHYSEVNCFRLEESSENAVSDM